MGDTDPDRYLIRFEINDSESVQSEGLWGEATGTPGDFTIDNIPFYARGINRGDIVRAIRRRGELVFDRVVRSGGRSTYQILLRPGKNERDLDRIIDDLEALGAAYEGVEGRLIAMDAPTAVSEQVTEVLESAFADETIWYEVRG